MLRGHEFDYQVTARNQVGEPKECLLTCTCGWNDRGEYGENSIRRLFTEMGHRLDCIEQAVEDIPRRQVYD